MLDETANLWNDITATPNAQASAFVTASGGANVAGYTTINKADSGFVAEQKYTVKIRITDPLMMDPVAGAIETIFQLTIFHKCSKNQFTLNDQTDISYSILAAGGTPAQNIQVSTVTGATAGCMLVYTIEVLNYPSPEWTTVSQANALSTYSFIVSAAALDLTSTNTFDIQTDDFAKWAGTTQVMRLRVRDPNSTLPGGNQVDDFKIVFTYACFLDEIKITTEILDQTYVFSTAAQQLLPTTVFSQKLAGCIKTYQLEIYSAVNHAWVKYVPVTSGHDYFINNWNSATGTVTVLNNGANGGVSLKPSVSYQMRISLTSDFS